MHFIFKPMNDDEARTIAAWHYEPPYDFYDMNKDLEDLKELLDACKRTDAYFSVINENDELIGFFTFSPQPEQNLLEIELGLRPDLTGKGLGSAFLEAGLTFARDAFAPASFALSVATFNKRAIRTYLHAGFRPRDIFMQQTNGSQFEFLRMIRTG
ncbi:GNAT family N-acetyltransferase [Ktedonosporobacter rubrisoli]|uniref:GNAT family N-acetyltransferase n=1 Tax=Ktedonosporobacter rubrisoli TaxID=2509675 RepID=A0A4P6K6F1_KTERU|nr:GNAT family N-acetyltransferase [Ktedonosporobacter rubrisoli]